MAWARRNRSRIEPVQGIVPVGFFHAARTIRCGPALEQKFFFAAPIDHRNRCDAGRCFCERIGGLHEICQPRLRFAMSDALYGELTTDTQAREAYFDFTNTGGGT